MVVVVIVVVVLVHRDVWRKNAEQVKIPKVTGNLHVKVLFHREAGEVRTTETVRLAVCTLSISPDMLFYNDINKH